MKIGKSHIAAFTVGLIPFVATMFFINRTPVGPEVQDKGPYYGCYGLSRPTLNITPSSVNAIASGQSTQLKRILSVKSDDAINTDRELIFNRESQAVDIGDRDTGFFYVFQAGVPTKTLILYDREGRSYRLPKRPC